MFAIRSKSLLSCAVLAGALLGCTSADVTPPSSLPLSTAGGCTAGVSTPLPASSWQPRENPELLPNSGGYAWKNVVVLGGGFVSGVVFSPSGTLYARTDVGGAYRWDNGPSGVADGRWVPLLDWVGRSNSNLMGVESIAPDPVDPNTVYLALGMYLMAGPGQILSSNDRGQTFTTHYLNAPMGGNEPGRSVGERLVVDPNLPSTLYFASRTTGLWTSADSALSWTQLTSFPVLGDAPAGLTLVACDAKSGSAGSVSQTIYVGVDSTTAPSLYRSIDAGASWASVPNQPAGLMPQHAALDKNGVLYLAYANSPGPSGTNGTRSVPGVPISDGAIYKYDPNGDVWTNITPLSPGNMNGKFGYGGLALDAQHPGALLVSTIDYWAPDQLYRSSDGASFTELASRAMDVAGAEYLYWHKSGLINGATGWVGSAAIDPTNPDRALYVTGQGLWWTEDLTAADRGQQTHWVFRDSGLEETVALAMVSPPSGPPLISGLGDVAGFAHEDLDAPPANGQFDTPIFGNTVSLDFAESAPTVVVRAGTASGGCGRGAWSSDGARTWQPFFSEPAGSNGQGSIAVSADGASIVWSPKPTSAAAATFVPLYYTNDRGQRWAPSAGVAVGSTGSVAADRVDANVFYALVSGPRVGNTTPAPVLYVSQNTGQNFEATSNSFGASPTLHAVFGRAGDVWVADANGLHHSLDFGVSFSNIAGTSAVVDLSFGKPQTDGGYPALYLTGIAPIDVGGTLAPINGVLRSDDGGATFTRIDDDQHGFGYVNHIAADPRLYGRIYLGTGGRGLIYGDLRQ